MLASGNLVLGFHSRRSVLLVVGEESLLLFLVGSLRIWRGLYKDHFRRWFIYLFLFRSIFEYFIIPAPSFTPRQPLLATHRHFLNDFNRIPGSIIILWKLVVLAETWRGWRNGAMIFVEVWLLTNSNNIILSLVHQLCLILARLLQRIAILLRQLPRLRTRTACSLNLPGHLDKSIGIAKRLFSEVTSSRLLKHIQPLVLTSPVLVQYKCLPTILTHCRYLWLFLSRCAFFGPLRKHCGASLSPRTPSLRWRRCHTLQVLVLIKLTSVVPVHHKVLIRHTACNLLRATSRSLTSIFVLAP